MFNFDIYDYIDTCCIQVFIRHHVFKILKITKFPLVNSEMSLGHRDSNMKI